MIRAGPVFLLALGTAGSLAAQSARPQEPAPPAQPASRFPAIEAAIAREQTRLEIPGLSAALVTNGQLRWTGGLGTADLENDVPATSDTVYRIASLTKPITAVAVLQLAERGSLDLDAPIRTYVPAFPEKPWPVSARQLLAHLGGIRHVAEDEWGSTRHYTSVSDALEVFKDDPLLHPPGVRSLYSTYGYCLLGAAIEGASGRPYLEYVKDNVFGPAGMEATRWDDVTALIPRRAPGYVCVNGELRNSILADTSNKIPGGGLCATAPDLARFAIALQSATLIRRDTWERMLTRQKLRNGQPTSYGLGWRLDRRRGQDEAWHHGGQPRVSTLLYMQPKRGLAVVLLANLEGVAPALLDLARAIADLAGEPSTK